MNILTALQISLFDFAIVFVALVLIALFIKMVSRMISKTGSSGKKESAGASGIYENTAGNPLADGSELLTDDTIGHGELKLYGVDEKTAAMIMAIVSDDTKIPLEELQFKSIKLLEN